MKEFFREQYSLDLQVALNTHVIHAEALSEVPKDLFYAPQGAGLSYVAASFGTGISTLKKPLNTGIISFDNSMGTIELQSGCTLGQVYDFLVASDWMLPIQPGHPAVTIGGCIAVDVHGKNQFKEGLFSSSVRSIQLFHPSYGELTCSNQENSEVFDLTMGGLGLTGFILSAAIQLIKKPGLSVTVENIQVKNLIETYQIMSRLKNEKSLLYSWNDCSHSAATGRGYIISGQYQPDQVSQKPLAVATLRPQSLPFALFNSLTTPAINFAYYLLNTKLKTKGVQSLFDFTFPVHNKVFYFSWYGPKGFIERQILIPESVMNKYLDEFRGLIQRHRPTIVLTTLKSFKGSSKFLRFTGDGFCLSLDLPANNQDHKFHFDLDNLNLKYNAIDNFVKDSRVNSNQIKSTYSDYNNFKRLLFQFDKRRIFRSHLSHRLDLDSKD
ncbi:MAG: FAD-binding oxidoreductase [Bdellovibrionales bacterium]|nr:FAD-binding oxidoreductase [Bdellovibrionales bacterium]